MKVLIVAIFLALMGCATVPAYNGHNQEEITKAKKFNKRMYWVVITAIAIVPYSVGSSDYKVPCRPHEDCYDPIP